MTKLILSMDGLVLKEIALNKERMTIGRRASNDIQIDNLAISGEHAAIVTILNDSFLEDLNSTNGTLVNGQPIKKHFLKNGDVVELGKYKLKYITEQAPSNEAADFEKTMVLRPSALGLESLIAMFAFEGLLRIAALDLRRFLMHLVLFWTLSSLCSSVFLTQDVIRVFLMRRSTKHHVGTCTNCRDCCGEDSAH